MKRVATFTASAVLSAVFVTVLAGGGADTREKLGLSDPNAPIAISADRFDADQKAKTLVYSGNAVARQGDVFLHTDTLRVQAAEDGKTADKIYAAGRVVVTSPSGTASGDRAVYDVDPRIITMTGNVVLVRDDNVMRGKVLKVDLVTGVANLDGGVAPSSKDGAAKTGAPGSRIQGLFHPRSFQKDDGGSDAQANPKK